MVLLRLDPEHAGPLHVRIAGAVRRAIADGDVVLGEALPPARDLAVAVGVNVNTVLRAYRDLRDEGLIELRRGKGAIVRGEVATARLIELADALLAEARRLGVSRTEVRRLLEERS